MQLIFFVKITIIISTIIIKWLCHKCNINPDTMIGVEMRNQVTNLQIWEHAQKTPQETAVYGLSTPLSLNKKQNPIDCLTLHLQVADDIETKQLQAHVPEDKTQEYQWNEQQSNGSK